MIMCAAMKFPETTPLRKRTAQNVVKALTKFFSTFWLPDALQTDQESNFTSTIFAQVMQLLALKHEKSSPYHPESLPFH